MPSFYYVAKRGPEEDIEGTLEAQSRRAALDHLVGLGYTPVRIQEKKDRFSASLPSKKTGKRVPTRQLNIFTRQFASLVRSHIPLLRALKILGEQVEHPTLKQALSEMGEEVRQGRTLSEAMEQHPRLFPSLYVSHIRSGEAGGMLEIVLERLADTTEREEAMQSKIQTALAYPSFVALMGFVTVTVMMTFVMPRLLKLYVGFGNKLPLPTRLLLRMTHIASSQWFWGFCFIAALVLFIVWRSAGPQGKKMMDQFTLKVPVLGQLIQKMELARFSRSFGLLLEHGVPIFKAVEVSTPVLKHPVIRQQLESISVGLKEGKTLSECLRKLSVVTPFMVNTITVGEEGGKLGAAFSEVTHFYDREVERLLQVWVALLEPILILGVGCIIGFIVMAILLPIFEVSTLAH